MISDSIVEAILDLIMFTAAVLHTSSLIAIIPLTILGVTTLASKVVLPKEIPADLILLYLKYGVITGIIYLLSVLVMIRMPELTNQTISISPEPTALVSWTIIIGVVVLLAFLYFSLNRISNAVNTKEVDPMLLKN